MRASVLRIKLVYTYMGTSQENKEHHMTDCLHADMSLVCASLSSCLGLRYVCVVRMMNISVSSIIRVVAANCETPQTLRTSLDALKRIKSGYTS